MTQDQKTQDKVSEAGLSPREAVVSICRRSEITIDWHEESQTWTLTVATEDEDIEVWLDRPGLKGLQQMLRQAISRPVTV